MDMQRCMPNVPNSTSTARDAACTSSPLLDVHGVSDHHPPIITDLPLASRTVQDSLYVPAEVRVPGCFSAIEPLVVQLAELRDDPDNLFREFLDLLSGSDMLRPAPHQDGPHFITEVRTSSAVEPAVVQLTGSGNGIDSVPDDPHSRAATCPEDLHSQQEVQAPGPVKTAEPFPVQLGSLRYDLDLDRLSEHHSRYEPSAPATAQLDDCVALTDARAQDRDRVAALRVV
ncbi:uncharacterized protein B0H18DRAFT_316540 [Fomitopsis serialis]|uniref:uncharacterized protein n=1 Tax=Fomitopsis serialis TaxID=139415 RepID=UPI0020086D84|nr:uncharacterized protein B0H18DRAFT_360939 [Neoantrodia serialis]XP_047899580.1 uncharacterized protein B0H18DRAFT_316540 [Neoantrodia serialis]KAH9926047.1 hypothetical protein B0H18DRAFT_360939 [Neoantrodia serialis]KAH9936216.1 hypothetical protein B0H18DRAFT_316540 [Neoantrodia serialis]